MKRSNKILSGFISFFILGFLFFMSGEAFSAIYYVSTTGSDSNSGTGSAPFKTIQKAANTVNPGDTVIVKDGTYTDTDGDNYIVKLSGGGTSDKWITFRSENKWGAVLDGEGTAGYGWSITAGSYIQIEDFEVKNMKNVGFHINNTSNSTNIYYYRNKVHDIARRKISCTASDVTIGHSGFFNPFGSKYITYDSNVIYNVGRLPGGCDAQKDHALDHGIYAHSYNTTIRNNVFYNNTSGWGIQLDGREGTSDWKIINNTFYGKNPEKDGHIIIWGNCDNIIIQNNISHSPLNYFIHAGAEQNDDTVNIKNNLVYGASVLRASGSGYTQSGNITGQDPHFVSLTNKDFHLQADSPAIDKGLFMSGYDADADGNLIFGDPDIGAYEYVRPSTDTTSPSVPTGLKATAASTSQIDLSWTVSTDNVAVSGYRIYREGNQIAEVNTSSYSDTGLAESTTYKYTVSAYDTAGNLSGQSAAVIATTLTPPDTTSPTIPTSLQATVASVSRINLTWSASSDNTGVTGYVIYRNGNLIATSTATSYADTGLSAETSYSYWVAAYDQAGNVSGQSATVSAMTFSTMLKLLSPNGGEVLNRGTWFEIGWDASSDETLFDLRYSTDGGSTWSVIASKVPGRSYSWFVASSKASRNCLIKVIGYNSSNTKLAVDVSNRKFSIK